MKFLKRFMCNHKYNLLVNKVYVPTKCGFVARYTWRCSKCGKQKQFKERS